MNWPAAIFAFAVWLGLMIWTTRKRTRVFAMCLLMTSGYVLLPVPVDLPLSEVFGLKAAAVTLSGLLVLLISRADQTDVLPRIKWWDSFMLLWLVVEVAAEIYNSRPGTSAATVGAEMLIQWVLPYALGRWVLQRDGDFLVLTRMIVWAALLLSPLALYESIWGPYLHRMLYGIALISSIHTFPLILDAWGPANYRPMLFFEGSHLAASFFFGAAAVVQSFLMAGESGALCRKKWDVIALVVLIATTFNCRAYLGIAVLLAGFIILLSIVVLRTRLLLVLLLLGLPAYVGLRASGAVPTPDLTGRKHADPFHKNYSLWFRMYQEDVVLQLIKDRNAEFLGLGSAIPGDQDWRQYIGPTTGLSEILWIDSLWIWLLLRTGWLGLSVAYLAVMTPMMAAVIKIPSLKQLAKQSPQVLAAIALLVVVGLDLMDWTMNSHQSTLWAFALGGLGSASVAWRREKQFVPGRTKVIVSRVISQ